MASIANSMKKYETIDHTADLGIKVFGRDREELFVNAAYALFDLITDIKKVEEKISFEVAVEGNDGEDLMINWLGELLYLSQGRELLLKNFNIENLDETSIKAIVAGEMYQPRKHTINLEIKAVTYHQVEIKQAGNKWSARIIFDL